MPLAGLLSRTTPAELENWTHTEILEPIAPGRYFFYTDVDFQNATRSRNWYVYMTTWQLLQEMNRPGNLQQASLAVIFHQRLTRPILGILLVFMGLIGTFIGLLHMVGSMGGIIGSLASSSGGAGPEAFQQLLGALQEPLKGMASGFAASLFGLFVLHGLNCRGFFRVGHRFLLYLTEETAQAAGCSRN